MGTIVSAIALGSVGFLAAILSNSVIVGYLVSMGCFLFHLLGNISEENILFLFSMSKGNYQMKIWLICVSVVMIIAAVFYKEKIYSK